MRSRKSLSELAGFYMAKGIYCWMTVNPAWLLVFAERFGIGSRLLKCCRMSAAVLFLFLVTDIHRYGAWYTGGATYIKPWWQYAYVLLWVPFALVIIRCIIEFLDRHQNMLLLVPAAFAVIFTICFAAVCVACMVYEGFYIFHGYVFLRGRQLEEILELSIAVSAMFTIPEAVAAARDWLAALLEKIFGGSESLISGVVTLKQTDNDASSHPE